jgi:hypothetical protein
LNALRQDPKTHIFNLRGQAAFKQRFHGEEAATYIASKHKSPMDGCSASPFKETQISSSNAADDSTLPAAVISLPVASIDHCGEYNVASVTPRSFRKFLWHRFYDRKRLNI